MSRLSRIAASPAGSWTKWVVICFWPVVLVVAYAHDRDLLLWWPSRLARTPDPAPAELGLERAAALAGARALRVGGLS